MPKQKWQFLSAIKLYTPTLDANVLSMTNNDATNCPTMWQQTSITFFGYQALYANYSLSLLDSVKQIQGNIIWVCLTLQ